MRSLTRLCLVRHGETTWNTEKRLQGHLDIGLNANGVAQAIAAGRALSTHLFSAVYSSDLERAQVTARHIAANPGMPIATLTDLRERHYGHFQGLTYEEARSSHPEEYARFLDRDPEFAFSGGGESLTAFARRIEDALKTIVGRHAGEQVLVVTHGGVLDIIHRMTSGKSLGSARDFTIPNAALNWISHDQGQWTLISWGDESHLNGALDELGNA